ncbi:MAG: twin-arginine translocase TatA/TatE family subunit [Nitrospirae bacterium]|nr:twin-arginine translocase TatA/TatE family subunit [Nitrospirota bacterium]
MFGLGLPELGIVLTIVIVLFGSSKLPQLGKSIGGVITNFRSSIAGKEDVESNVNKELK